MVRSVDGSTLSFQVETAVEILQLSNSLELKIQAVLQDFLLIPHAWRRNLSPENPPIKSVYEERAEYLKKIIFSLLSLGDFEVLYEIVTVLDSKFFKNELELLSFLKTIERDLTDSIYPFFERAIQDNKGSLKNYEFNLIMFLDYLKERFDLAQNSYSFEKVLTNVFEKAFQRKNKELSDYLLNSTCITDEVKERVNAKYQIGSSNL